MTIGTFSSAQEASKKMRDNNISSLVVIDDKNNKKPTGIVTEHDLVRKLCVSSIGSSGVAIKDITSSPLVTIDADYQSKQQLM